MTKHTPGPWSFDRDWCRLPTIFGADGKKIAIVEKTSRNEHTSEQAANARLIEAAPDLLAACVDLTDQLSLLARDAKTNPWVQQGFAAIAKAGGAISQDERHD